MYFNIYIYQCAYLSLVAQTVRNELLHYHWQTNEHQSKQFIDDLKNRDLSSFLAYYLNIINKKVTYEITLINVV